MCNLFLDDERFTSDAFYLTGDEIYNTLQWDIVRNFEQFKCFILSKHNKGEFVSLISFDNDLGFIGNTTEEMRGVDCAKWLIDFCLDNNLDFPKYRVHSQNVVAAEHISGIIESFNKFKRENI